MVVGAVTLAALLAEKLEKPFLGQQERGKRKQR